MKRYHWICLAVALAVVLLAAPAWAAEELPEWRKIWDVVWRVLNFLILAGLIVKYGRQPMKDFLAGQRDTLAEEIKEMEEAKAEAEADLKDIEDRIAGLADELGKFEESVASQAAKVREEIMATAEFEANAILERTKRQSEMALEQARKDMASELVELAGMDAVELVQAAINSEDLSRLVDEFNSQVTAESAA